RLRPDLRRSSVHLHQNEGARHRVLPRLRLSGDTLSEQSARECRWWARACAQGVFFVGASLNSCFVWLYYNRVIGTGQYLTNCFYVNLIHFKKRWTYSLR